MSQETTVTQVLPRVESFQRIFHPTDFSGGAESAFIHALKLAVNSNALLEILHVDRHPESVDWEDFPQVRQTLAQWGLLPDWALPEDVGRLGIGVHKHLVGGNAPVDAILDHMDRHEPDLVVLATHHRDGLDRWLHQDIAKRVARISHRACLFVPHEIPGFVRRQDGEVALKKVLIPVAKQPDAQSTISWAWELTQILKCESVEATLVHVGNDNAVFDSLSFPNLEDWTWEVVVATGDPSAEILKIAERHNTDLIVMTTGGRHGFLDVLRGSTSEQVTRHAACPILSVPTGQSPYFTLEF